MSCFRLSCLNLMALAVSVVVAPSARAQQPMPKQVMGFKGKLAESIPNQGITVTDPTKNNALVLVAINANTKVSVEGTADVSYLGPGVAVDFVAEMTRLGKTEGELDKITVTELDTEPGVFQPEDVTKSLPTDKNAFAKMHVRGTIRSIKGGLMQVAVPGAPPIRIKLAASPTIKVLVHNPSWAQPGDPVQVDGLELAAAQGDQPQKILGTVVKITMEKQLEGKKKTVPMRKRPAKS